MQIIKVHVEHHSPYLAYNRVRETSKNQSKENSQCRGINDIIEIAFSERTDPHCDYKYVLPFLGYIHFNLGIRTEESCPVAPNGNPDAQSDTLVTIPSKINDKLQNDRLSFTDPSTIDNLYWSSVESETSSQSGSPENSRRMTRTAI